MSVDPPRAVARDREPPRRGPDLPARPGVHRPGQRHGRPVRRGRGRLEASGRGWRASGSTGRGRSTRPSSGTCRSPSGSSAASSTSPTTASTATSSAASATRSPTTGSASPATPGRSPTPTSSARSARRPTRCSELGVETGDRVAIYMPMIPELPIAMLACARIGAPHTVVFGGFSRRGAGGPHQRRPGQARHHRRRRLAARQGGAAQAGRRRGARADARPSSTRSSSAGSATRSRAARRCRTAATSGGTTSSIASPPTAAPVAGRLRAHALPALHLGDDGQAQGHHAHDRRLPPRHELHPRDGLRHQARRRVLVRRRHRLGDRPQLHRLRAAGQRDDRRPVRGHARHARPGTAGGRSSRTTRSRSCTAPRPRSARS